ncbi:MAG: M4 family metallopeptidase [Planctomycetota bacterium]
MRVSRPLSLLVLPLLAACGGGGSSGQPDAPEFEFLVGPPAAARSGLNQRPPEELLQTPLVPRLRADRAEPLTREEEVALGAVGRTDALARLGERGYDEDHDVVVRRVQRDPYGGVHVKMGQTYRGVPILGGGIGCHDVPGRSRFLTEQLVPPVLVDTEPSTALATAIGRAETGYAARETTRDGLPTQSEGRLVIWPTLDWVRVRSSRAEDHTEDFERQLVEARLVWEVVVSPVYPSDESLVLDAIQLPEQADADDADTAATRRDSPVRGGRDPDPEPDHGHAPLDALMQPAVRYLVDAATGEIVDERVLIDHDDELDPAVGVGYSYASGVVPLSVAYRPSNNTYYLMDVERPDVNPTGVLVGSYVLDAQNLETHDAGEMAWIRDWNNQWGDGSIYDSEGSPIDTPRRQTPGVDVAHGIQMTWDFLDHVLGFWGPDGLGTRTRACVHYGNPYGDAHWNGSSQFICFGDGNSISSPGNYGLATVAHELGHAMWSGAGIEQENGEADALNEGTGDIQGGLVFLYRATGSGQGALVIRQPYLGGWRGRVVNPAGYDETDDEGVEYTGLSYWSSTLEDGPEHVGGLPYGRAMIYLAEGAPADEENTLYTTEFPGGLGGIGITRAAIIWHYATAYLVSGSPTYPDMRQAWLDAAQTLFGVGSMPDRAVRRAFAAIRVGSSWGDPDPPTIAYAQVFDVNTRDMTAAVFAVPTDDTGFKEMRIETSGTPDHLFGDWFLGYVSIARAPVGVSDATITIEDGTGKTASVVRPFLKPRDRNLITNGDFENGMGSWVSESGVNQTAYFPSAAFLGEQFLRIQGVDRVWQDVTIPPDAEDVALVFRVLVRDIATADQSLRLTIQDPAGGVITTLLTIDRDNPPDTRDWVNRGWLRQELDMSAYAGQTIRLAFHGDAATGDPSFLVDHVMMTYDTEVTVGLPQVEVAEYDRVVSFKLPDIEGASTAEILRVDWYLDGVFVGAGEESLTDYYGAWFTSALTPGMHWVGGRVRALDGSVLVDSFGVWFETGLPFNELLPDGSFESGAWDLAYGDPPPRVQVIPNGSYPKAAFRGTQAVKLGDVGELGDSQVGVVVQMPGPQAMSSLTLSLRMHADSSEPASPPGPIGAASEALWVEFWDMSTFVKISEYAMATHEDGFVRQGTRHGWRGYIRLEQAISAWPLAGKEVLVRLRAHEDDGLPTTFYVDNVSLRYQGLGVVGGGL